ncbi:MAG: TraR/DksA family transcriptional regulator [Acidimicrobiia bacterium]|nr:TraR/DksA family transcriptional regulator [Acidimicrobiia bacterium]
MTDFDSARHALLAERTKLVRQLEELGATEAGELKSGLDLGDGFADAASATAERTELLGLAESLSSQVAEIDDAMKSIENGTYGVCAGCGTPISEARLEARPASILCVNCKSNRPR